MLLTTFRIVMSKTIKINNRASIEKYKNIDSGEYCGDYMRLLDLVTMSHQDTPSNERSFGSIFREIRDAAGFSQAGLGRESGVAQSNISQIESNAVSPQVSTIAILLSTCGVDLLSILERVAAAKTAQRNVDELDYGVSGPLAQVLDDLGPAVEQEKPVLIAMDRYGLFARETDPAKARKAIFETWWQLKQDSGRG